MMILHFSLLYRRSTLHTYHENMHSIKIGFEDISQRLQTSICCNLLISLLRESQPGVTGGNICFVKQKCHTNSAAQAEAGCFLFEVFPGPKEWGKWLTSHPGSPCFEDVSQEIQLLHFHTRSPK